MNNCPPNATASLPPVSTAAAPLFSFLRTVVASSRRPSTFLASKSLERPTLRHSSPGHRCRPSFAGAAARHSHPTGEPPLPLPWLFVVKWAMRSCRAATPTTREALHEPKLAGWPSLAPRRPCRVLCSACAPRACAEPCHSGRAPWPHAVGWPGCFGPRQARPPWYCAARSRFLLAGPAHWSLLCGLGRGAAFGPAR
jgi:hypothetical protein